jgi:membrane glycosyltransferase
MTKQPSAILAPALFFGSVLALWVPPLVLFWQVLSAGPPSLGKYALFGCFALLFGYLIFGFCHAFFGFVLRFVLGRKRGEPSLSSPVGDAAGRVAIIAPIYNEEVDRTIRGFQATFDSVLAQEDADAFDFYLLSDSNEPLQWLHEEAAWLDWVEEKSLQDRVFYRRRGNNVGKKSGNVADFCEVKGADYEFMVVLDADSVMSGETIVALRQRMMAEPGLGLLQTVPRLVGGASIFGRMQQFANRLYGPVFMEGLAFWQQGHGNFWGHNAIIRIEPFVKHCGLPELTLPGPLGGQILSHDFVEAGLLCRAGWEIRLMPELPGSYEEGPQSLIDSATRDRRWCQGNLQHLFVLPTEGLTFRTRVHLLNGVMGYLSSALWLLLIILSLLFLEKNPNPGEGPALKLLLLTVVLLFSPKFFCWLDLARDARRRKGFGGMARAGIGMIGETVLSALIAPINMIFFTTFLTESILGKRAAWGAQNRVAGGTSWRGAWRVHRWQMAAGVCLLALAVLEGGLIGLALTLPILVGLLASLPLSVWTSRRGLEGSYRFWQTPEETEPSSELLSVFQDKDAVFQEGPKPTLVDYLLNPALFSRHLVLLSGEGGQRGEAGVVPRVLAGSLEDLSKDQQFNLFQDPTLLKSLHLELWQREDEELSDYWSSRRKVLLDPEQSN